MPGLAFAAPFVLIALAALPAIWWLLRVTPPQPKQVVFPPLAIAADLMPQARTPARTPLWLLLLRLTIAGLLIAAAAGPSLQSSAPTFPPGKGPLLLILDTGFVAAPDWALRLRTAEAQIAQAERQSRPVALLSTAAPQEVPVLLKPADAFERLRAFKPVAYWPERAALAEPVTKFLETHADSNLVWISDGLASPQDEAFLERLKRSRPSLILYTSQVPQLHALAGFSHTAASFKIRVIRPLSGAPEQGVVRAYDQKQLPLGEASFTFNPQDTETTASFDLPIELRNTITRVEVAGMASAGAVALVDAREQRRRVGIVSGTTTETAQPLLSPAFYVAKALAPYAEVRERREGTSEAIAKLLDEKVSVLILTDVGALDAETARRVSRFVDQGGVLVRFAGSRLAAGNDDLVPVRLRRGGRTLGGALSWDTPRSVKAFERESPFYGLEGVEAIQVQRQILAEPSLDLSSRTWASLVDGTPMITAEQRGQGRIILFHVTADPSWSNLPLSGLFVDMLRRLITLSGPSGEAGSAPLQTTDRLAPTLILDGFGVLGTPPSQARAIDAGFAGRANMDHPAGFYGPDTSAVAVNALVPKDTFAVLDASGLQATRLFLDPPKLQDLRGLLLAFAGMLFLVDTLVTLWLGGYGLKHLQRSAMRHASVALFALVLMGWSSHQALAQQSPARPSLSAAEVQAAQITRLAHVITGNAEVDAAAKAGLEGLTLSLSARTAIEPGDPVGVDPARDELVFYPVLYWPIAPERPQPSGQALRKLDAYMKGGGLVIFDTRDALSIRASGPPSPALRYLRTMLATLDIPELEPVPSDHVLTKSFYLLDSFPGRYAHGETWVEALPPVEAGERRPARAGDSVTPLLITSNDLAAAWAIGPSGEPLYPVSGGGFRQREMSLRTGVNIVIHALTGNYKADQVHVPALLERLGQ